MKSIEESNNKVQLVELRSILDFQRASWLTGDQHFYTGIYKTADNLYYDIKWSKTYDYSIKYKSEMIEIKSTPWTQPFHLQIEEKAFNNDLSDKVLALGLQKFVSHFIDCIEHLYLQIGVLNFSLDGRPILYRDPTLSGDWRPLDYRVQDINYEEIFEEYSLLGDTGHFDCVCGEAADLSSLELPWRLLIDSIASFKSGRFKGCVIYATSAFEVESAPVIREWMVNNTYTSADDDVDNALVVMSNPMKIEIFFKLKNDILTVLPSEKVLSLLKGIKWLNRIRNRVVHEGKDVNADEAKRAIRTAGILLRVLWVQNRVAFFKSQGIDLEDWLSKLPEVDL
jgi:hypothetical protein